MTGRGQVSGHIIQPPVWLGERPPGAFPDHPPGLITAASTREPIHEADLPGDVRGRAFRDGLVAIDFSSYAPAPRAFAAPEPGSGHDEMAELHRDLDSLVYRCELFNAHLACLLTALVQEGGPTTHLAPVTPHHLFYFDSLQDLENVSLPNDLASQAAFATRWGAPEDQLDPLDHGLRRLLTVSRSAVVRSFDLLGHVLDRGEMALRVADLLLRGGSAYGDHNYGFSVVLSWTAVESLMGNMLIERLERETHGNSRLAKKRANVARAPARVIQDLLVSLAVIGPDLGDDIGKVREARNQWLHRQSGTNASDGQLGITTAQKLLNLHQGIELNLPLHLTWHM